MFVYFAFQTFRHIKKNGRQTDRLSLLTLLCLGSSFFIFLIYGSLKAALDIKTILATGTQLEDLNDWLRDNQVMVNCIFAVTRHPAYLLNNLALFFNLQRWSLLINKEQKLNDNGVLVTGHSSINSSNKKKAKVK